MKIRKRTIMAALAVMATGLGIMPQAQADDPWPLYRHPTNEVCVIADFAETGSGWGLHASIRDWNNAQSVVHLSAHVTPGCSRVNVHLYTNGDGYACGITQMGGVQSSNGVFIIDHADVYLNNARICRPYPLKRWRKYVMAHELGHAMGLGHTFGDQSSVMCYCNDWYGNKGRPGPNDVATLVGLYSTPAAPPIT